MPFNFSKKFFKKPIKFSGLKQRPILTPPPLPHLINSSLLESFPASHWHKYCFQGYYSHMLFLPLLHLQTITALSKLHPKELSFYSTRGPWANWITWKTLEKKILNFINVFFAISVSPIEKRLNPNHQTKDALCQVWLKLA